jgi:STE24 endopeptidase
VGTEMKKIRYAVLIFLLIPFCFAQPVLPQTETGQTQEYEAPSDSLEQVLTQTAAVESDREERLEHAVRYQRTKNIHYFADQGYSILFMVLFLFLGISAFLRRQLQKLTKKRFWVVALYTVGFLIVSFIVGFPSSYYGFSLEHKYGLSNQTFSGWFGEELLGLLVITIIALIAVEGIYLALKKAPKTWWIYVSVVFIFFTVVLVNLAPVLIMPLFNVYTPLPQGELRDRLVQLSNKAGVEVEDIFTMDMSKQTKKANAMFTGLGNTKRIVLGDNMVDEFTTDEVEVVIAHEMGHNLMHHIWKGIALASVIAAIGFFIIHMIGPWIIFRFRNSLKIENMADVASLPLIFLIFMIYGIITMPVAPAFSRQMERQTDRFAIDMTHKNDAFITAMEKLAYMNLSDPEPSPVIEFLLYDHPPISKRIKFAQEYKPEM